MNNFEKLIEKIDIVEFISNYVKLSKSGENYKGFSPFKEEKTPSFVVSPRKKIFKDFSTGIGGNVVRFYAEINKIEYTQALHELYIKYNITTSNLVQKNQKYYNLINKVHEIYIEELKNNEFAKKYLLDRGYTDEDIENFKLGYSNENFKQIIENLKEDYEIQDLEKIGVVKGEYDSFNNRIIIPIYDSNSNLIAFGGRSVFSDDNSPKYLNSSDTILFKKSNELFSKRGQYSRIKEDNLVILMEGYFDVLTTLKHSNLPAFASLGTSLTDEQAKKLKKYTNRVIICYDNDEAGQEAVYRAIEKLVKYDFEIKCVNFSKNVKDPDEYLNKYGYDEFFMELANSQTLIKYLVRYLKEKIKDSETITGKTKIVFELKNIFKNIHSAIYRELYIKELAQELSINPNSISEEYNFKKNDDNFNENNGQTQKMSYNNSVGPNKLSSQIEKNILMYVVYYREDIDKFKNVHLKNYEYQEDLDQLRNSTMSEEKIKNYKFYNDEELNFTKFERQKYILDLLKKYYKDEIENIKYDEILRIDNLKINMSKDEYINRKMKINKKYLEMIKKIETEENTDNLNNIYENFINKGGGYDY